MTEMAAICIPAETEITNIPLAVRRLRENFSSVRDIEICCSYGDWGSFCTTNSIYPNKREVQGIPVILFEWDDLGVIILRGKGGCLDPEGL